MANNPLDPRIKREFDSVIDELTLVARKGHPYTTVALKHPYTASLLKALNYRVHLLSPARSLYLISGWFID